MNKALAYEWFRVRSLRSTWVLLLSAGVVQFASGLYWGLKRDLGDLDAFVSSFGLTARLGALLVAAVGVCAFGLDYQHGTIATTRLVVRAPGRIVGARALVTGGLGLLAGVLMVVLAGAGVLAGGGTLPADAARGAAAAGGVVLLTVLSGLAGVALGGLLRHTAAGLGVFAVWTLIAETILGAVVKVPMTALPFNGTALLSTGASGWTGPLVFAALVAAALTATKFTLARRDT
ncbi:hypothetical protein AB5J62_13610 [Amycolatopsis sp. cg5]|uniref:hypothetical protein n=1 Tax=Amycolatopsis sp. cg5 TaxID=3238802 RepID=UPI0035250808